jgi:uncharacterized protein YqkB
MDIREEAEKVMWSLVRLMKTQKAVAKALGKNKQTFNYWFNHAQKIPHKQFIAMQELLKKKQVQLNLAISKNNVEPDAKTEQKTTNLTLSQRVKLAMAFEQELGKRQGQRTDKVTSVSPLRRTCDEVKARTNEFVAKKFNFKSRDHYVRARKVVISGINELIAAMDSEIIPVYHAERLSYYSTEFVKDLLLQGKNAVKTYLKLHSSSQLNSSKMVSVNVPFINKYLHADIFFNEKLLKAEQECCLPLRIIFMGLLVYCNKCGGFELSEKELRNCIVPYVDINFKKILETLLCTRQKT